MFSPSFWHLAGIAVVIFTLIGASHGQDSPTPAVPRASRGVLVLHNGNVLSGHIEHVGDRFRVLVGQGEISIPEEKVKQFAYSLQDAYRRMRATTRNTLLGRLELADWCIEQDLFPEAADELLAAMDHNARDPRIAALRRRLENRARSRALSSPPQGNTGDGAVRQVAAEEMAEQPARMKDQPPIVLETFRRSVLPLLLNGCAANRCHGNAQSGGFALYAPRARHLSRRLMERNWEAVVEWIEASDVKTSTLLSRARTGHGGEQSPTFPEDGEYYATLRDWVERQAVALRGPDAPKSKNSEPPTDDPQIAMPTTQSPPPPATRRLPVATEPAPLGTPNTRRPPKAIASSDPFDPAEFNREFHPNGKP